MRHALFTAMFSWLLLSTQGSEAVAQPHLGPSFTADQHDSRAIKRLHRKQNRKALRKQVKNRDASTARRKEDEKRWMRENQKQLKKMEKASKKENRKSWGTNEMGDVFGVY